MNFSLKNTETRILGWGVLLLLLLILILRTTGLSLILFSELGFYATAVPLLLVILWLCTGKTEKLTMLLRILGFFWYLCMGTFLFLAFCMMLGYSR